MNFFLFILLLALVCYATYRATRSYLWTGIAGFIAVIWLPLVSDQVMKLAGQDQTTDTLTSNTCNCN